MSDCKLDMTGQIYLTQERTVQAYIANTRASAIPSQPTSVSTSSHFGAKPGWQCRLVGYGETKLMRRA